MKVEKLVIAIPTCSDSPQDIRIGYVLQALALQRGSLPVGTSILVRDEGKVACTEDPWVRLILNMLARLGMHILYERRDYTKRKGVGPAKADLLRMATASNDTFVLCLDDDLVLAENALYHLFEAAASVKTFGFMQGGKVELDPERTYANDVNLSTEIPTAFAPMTSPATFGDGAFLLLSGAAVGESVDLDLIASVAVPGVAGEDVMLSAMLLDKHPCYLANRAYGFHMTKKVIRWRWEAPADLYNIERLLSVVKPQTLVKIFPHLSEYIKSRQ